MHERFVQSFDLTLEVVPRRGSSREPTHGRETRAIIQSNPGSLVNTPPVSMGFHGMETHGNPHIDSYHGFPRVSRYPW